MSDKKPNTDTDAKRYKNPRLEEEYKKQIEKEQKLLEEQEIKAGKLKKKMLIFGIILIVLILAYIALALYNKTLA